MERSFRMGVTSRAAARSAQADEGEDRQHDDDEADEIDDLVHGRTPFAGSRMQARETHTNGTRHPKIRAGRHPFEASEFTHVHCRRIAAPADDQPLEVGACIVRRRLENRILPAERETLHEPGCASPIKDPGLQFIAGDRGPLSARQPRRPSGHRSLARDNHAPPDPLPASPPDSELVAEFLYFNIRPEVVQNSLCWHPRNRRAAKRRAGTPSYNWSSDIWLPRPTGPAQG